MSTADRDYGLSARHVAELRRYVDAHRKPASDLLVLVLENDLQAVVGFIATTTWEEVRALVRFVANEVPGPARGSRQNVNLWLTEGDRP